MNRHTHYDNLKVARDAPQEVIRAAYKALSQRYHPDKNPGNAEAARIMRLVNTSYEVLIDPEKRRAHDAWIHEQEEVEHARQEAEAAKPTYPNEPQVHHSPWPQGSTRKSALSVYWRHAPAQFKRVAVMGALFLVGLWISEQYPAAPKLTSQDDTLIEAPTPEAVAPAPAPAPAPQPAWHAEKFRGHGVAPPESSTKRQSNVEGTTRAQWDKLSSGMSEKDVLSLLGTPISIVSNGDDDRVLYYSADDIQGPFVRVWGGKLHAWGGDLRLLRTKGSQGAAISVSQPSPRCLASGADAGFPASSFNGNVPGRPISHTDGMSTLTVDNSRVPKDAMVKLIALGANSAARTFLVAASSTHTINSISPGSYKIMYRYRGECASYEANKRLNVEERETDNETLYTKLTITLYAVPGGKMRFNHISPDTFDRL